MADLFLQTSVDLCKCETQKLYPVSNHKQREADKQDYEKIF